jgi:hypothetical protein
MIAEIDASGSLTSFGGRLTRFGRTRGANTSRTVPSGRPIGLFPGSAEIVLNRPSRTEPRRIGWRVTPVSGPHPFGQVQPRTRCRASLIRHILRCAAQDCQYTLRRTTTARLGATTIGRTTRRPTTTAPRGPAQPARYTPRAQTTALASIVLKAMKPPASNRGIIRCFMTALLGCQPIIRSVATTVVWRLGAASLRPRRQLPVSSRAWLVDRESGSQADGPPRSMSRHRPRSRLRSRI